MDAVPAARLISHDRDCREIHGNRAGHDVLRIPMGQNLSRTADIQRRRGTYRCSSTVRMVPADQLPIQRAARGEEFRNYEEEIRFNDGKVTHLFAVWCRCATRRDPRGAIGAFLDVTRLKEVEEALRLADRRKDDIPRPAVRTSAQSAHADPHRRATARLRADPQSRHDIDVIVRQ
jgi:hypothetical protein